MDFIEGEDLRDRMDRFGILEEIPLDWATFETELFKTYEIKETKKEKK